MVPPLFAIGIGVGCIFQPILVALQAHSIKSRRAVIISNRNFFRCAGGACGLAVSAAVLQGTLRARLPTQYSYLADSTYTVPDLSGSDASSILDAYMAASRAVFILQIPLIGICLVGCLLIKDRGLEPPEEQGEKQNGGQIEQEGQVIETLGQGRTTTSSQNLYDVPNSHGDLEKREQGVIQKECEKS